MVSRRYWLHCFRGNTTEGGSIAPKISCQAQRPFQPANRGFVVVRGRAGDRYKMWLRALPNSQSDEMIEKEALLTIRRIVMKLNLCVALSSVLHRALAVIPFKEEKEVEASDGERLAMRLV